MATITVLFIVPFDAPDPRGFAGEVLIERRRQGHNLGPSTFEYLTQPAQTPNRWDGLLPMHDVDLERVGAVVEPNGAWHEFELQWGRDLGWGAKRTEAYDGFRAGLAKLLRQYDDHLALLHEVRI